MKTTRRVFQWIGLWIAVLPFLGFPPSWKRFLLVITGLAIITLSYLYLRKRTLQKGKTERAFVESDPNAPELSSHTGGEKTTTDIRI